MDPEFNITFLKSITKNREETLSINKKEDHEV